MAEESQKDLIDFRRGRQQLLAVSNQKQQLQAQSSSLKAAIDELKETKEERVYKAVGNVLIQKDVKEVLKELEEGKNSIDLRAATLQKQEDSLINRLNNLRKKIEGVAVAESQEKEKPKGKKK